jgi:hypothetical protein
MHLVKALQGHIPSWVTACSSRAAPVVHGFVHAATPHQERGVLLLLLLLLLLLPKAVDAAQQLPQHVLAGQRAHQQQLAAAGQRQPSRLLVSLQGGSKQQQVAEGYCLGQTISRFIWLASVWSVLWVSLACASDSAESQHFLMQGGHCCIARTSPWSP